MNLWTDLKWGLWTDMNWFMNGYEGICDLRRNDLWLYDFSCTTIHKMLSSGLPFFTTDCFTNDVTFKITDMNDMQTIWVILIFVYVSIKLRVHGPTEG